MRCCAFFRLHLLTGGSPFKQPSPKAFPAHFEGELGEKEIKKVQDPNVLINKTFLSHDDNGASGGMGEGRAVSFHLSRFPPLFLLLSVRLSLSFLAFHARSGWSLCLSCFSFLRFPFIKSDLSFLFPSFSPLSENPDFLSHFFKPLFLFSLLPLVRTPHPWNLIITHTPLLPLLFPCHTR